MSTRKADAVDLMTERLTAHLRAVPVHHDPIAVVEVTDRIGERGERDRVGTEIHFAVAVTDSERRALASADQQIFFAVEHEDEREGSTQARQRR